MPNCCPVFFDHRAAPGMALFFALFFALLVQVLHKMRKKLNSARNSGERKKKSGTDEMPPLNFAEMATELR